MPEAGRFYGWESDMAMKRVEQAAVLPPGCRVHWRTHAFLGV